MKNAPSIVTVARQADVSVGTVSRVMNRHPAVTVELRRRVLRASRELGFVPKMSHRCIALLTGRHSPAMPVGYVSVLSSMLTRLLSSHRCLVEVIDIENLDLVYEAHVDGLIGVVFDDRLLSLKQVPNLPIVTINRPLAEHGIHSVYADHYQQACLATQHLLDKGHRDIGFLAIQGDEWGSSERLRGFTQTLEKAGIKLDPSRVQYTLGQTVYDVLVRWRQRGVTAILNFSEDVGLEVLHILGNVLGLKIGQEMSTISLEDLPLHQYLSPPQTVVRQPLAKLAELAVTTLIDRIEKRNGNGDAVDICLPTELVERDSVADVARAR